MKISAFTMITRPDERQDVWHESINSVLAFVDEVIIVDGTPKTKGRPQSDKIKYIDYKWDYEWIWDEFPKHYNAGLAACSGDWALKFDVDYIFPENWVDDLRPELLRFGDQPTVSFSKYSAVLARKFYMKGQSTLAVNRRFDNACYGISDNKETDLCEVILQTGEERGLPKGSVPEGGRSALFFYNYSYTFKTKDVAAEEYFRFSRAYKRWYGETKMGETEDEAFEKFLTMMRERLPMATKYIHWKKQPLYIQDRVRTIKPKEFGHSGWGLL